MGSPRRFATAMVVAAAVGAATFGVTAAVAEQDEQPTTGSHDGALLERLGALEQQLPEMHDDSLDPAEEDSWSDFAAWAANLKTPLRTAEADLRSLFVDADDADGSVAEAVALVAQGWLDVMHASESFAVWSAHDLAFPIDTRDDDGVATGQDDLRGTVERGLISYLDGLERHLDGYSVLRDVGAAEGPAQNRLDQRAADAERFDSEHRAWLVHLLSGSSTTVLVPLDRFDTRGPGVESRAASMSYVCVDRQLLAEAPRPLTDEILLELEAATPERLDCGAFGIDGDDD